MSIIKRLCLLVFGLAGLVCLAALVLPAFGIYEREIAALLADPLGGRIVFGAVCVTAAGLVWSLLRALFSPRNRRSVIVSLAGGDEIQVTRDAIRAQAVHIIEQDGNLSARSVSIKAKKHGHVRVFARVQPSATVNVVERGHSLHDELMEGLSEVCGDTVDRVDIEFVDAVSHDEPINFERLEARYAASAITPAPSHEEEDRKPAPEDITVPMYGSSVRPSTPVREADGATTAPAEADVVNAAPDEADIVEAASDEADIVEATPDGSQNAAAEDAHDGMSSASSDSKEVE